MLRRALVAGAVATTGVGATIAYINYDVEFKWRQKLLRICRADLAHLNQRPARPLPARQEMISLMQKEPEYDVLVIGGGATGAGVVLDAQTRGKLNCI